MLPINKRARVVTASLPGKGEPLPAPPALVAVEGESSAELLSVPFCKAAAEKRGGCVRLHPYLTCILLRPT